MRFLEIFSSLPPSIKGLIGVFGAFGMVAIYLVVSTLADTRTQARTYDIENHIDQSLLPQLEEPKKPESFAVQKIVELIPEDSFKPEPAPIPKTKAAPRPKLTASVQKPKPSHIAVSRKIDSKPIVSMSINQASQQPVNSNLMQRSMRPVNQAVALRRQFNRKRNGFSKVVYTSGLSSSDSKKDLNKQDKWPVKNDVNTYPTDLTRIVTKEKFISAVLNNRIESTFAGKVLLTIDHNVYGSHGSKILIPIGTKASGSYQPVSEIGIERLSMSIERMVTPDGQLILFKNPAILADQQGATGVKGDIDNKYLQKFGLPLAFSVANNTTNLLFQKLLEAGTDAKNPESNLQQVFNEQWTKDQSQTNREIISDIIKNNINILPTISIEPGQKILLYLDHDIIFKPNKNGTTEVSKADI